MTRQLIASRQVLVSCLLDVTLFGPSSAAMHLENALWHALNSVLLYLLFARAIELSPTYTMRNLESDRTRLQATLPGSAE